MPAYINSLVYSKFKLPLITNLQLKHFVNILLVITLESKIKKLMPRNLIILTFSIQSVLIVSLEEEKG
jgi:hypothetical protein